MAESNVTRPVLHSERLLLRPYQLEDAENLQMIANDYDIAAMTRSFEFPYPLESAIQWIGNHEEFWVTGKAAIFAICWKPTGQLIGSAGLEICSVDHFAELGYWVAREFWNKGVATEAGMRLLRFGFDDLGLNRIVAHHMIRNPASGRVLEKIGMTREGLLRKHARKWGKYYDVATYGILASDIR